MAVMAATVVVVAVVVVAVVMVGAVGSAPPLPSTACTRASTRSAFSPGWAPPPRLSSRRVFLARRVSSFHTSSATVAGIVSHSEPITSGCGSRSMVRFATAARCRSIAPAGSAATTARRSARPNRSGVSPGPAPSTAASTVAAAGSGRSRTASASRAACR